MSFYIITGMSGSGKSRVINALEDIGFYCIDNVPPQFVREIVKLAQGTSISENLAIVVDARSKNLFDQFATEVEHLKADAINYKLIFIDCENEELLNRYKETRRKHPLMDEKNNSLQKAIEKERKMMDPVRSNADITIDTTYLSAHQLRQNIQDMIQNAPLSRMQIKLVSFGFKYGIPNDADIVYDVRCLPNPFYVPELREKSGLDEEVYNYVFQFEEARNIAAKLLDLLNVSIPLYLEEGKTQLVVALGCTGGKHRSISFVRYLEKNLKFDKVSVISNHRDFDRND